MSCSSTDYSFVSETMENIPIFIKHNGVWESDHSFVNFSVNGVLITSGCNFDELVSVIAKQLGKDLDTNLIDIKYIVKDGYPPMTVHSDMSVRVYIELKRMNSEFTMYPLCVTFKDRCAAGSCSNVNPATLSSNGIQSENKPEIYQTDAVEMISPVCGKDCNGIQANDKGVINNQDTVELINSVNEQAYNGVQTDEEGMINNIDIVEPITSVHVEDRYGIDDDVRGIVLINNPRHQDVEEGQLYQDKETIVSVMKHYAIRKSSQSKVERSSSTRYCTINYCIYFISGIFDDFKLNIDSILYFSNSYCLLCPSDNCSWCFKSSSLHQSKLFKVRKFNDVHTCPEEERLQTRLTSAGVVGGMIRNKYADSESVYTPADIIRDMKKDYGVDLTYMMAWRSKQKALNLLRGNKIESYGKLPSYLYMLMHTNPGSIVRLHKSEGGSFSYVFVSLDASIKGWKYCKPIVVVTASFLESAHRGP